MIVVLERASAAVTNLFLERIVGIEVHCKLIVLSELKKFLDISGNIHIFYHLFFEQIHSFNAKFRGKFFLHGFDVALHIRYDSGQSVKLSSRHYGVAKYGVYNVRLSLVE